LTGLKEKLKIFLTNPNKNGESALRGRVSFIWDAATDNACFWEVMKQIVLGYQTTIDKFAYNKYNKNFCELKPDEAADVLTNFRFFIEFYYPELYKWAEPHDFGELKFIEN
jgi:hypothetical protein